MKFLKLSAALALCAAGCGGTQVRRMDVNEVKDVSGRWNDTDARLVAEEMIQDSMSRPWLSPAQSRKGGPPAVVVQTVRNNSMEHINTDVFAAALACAGPSRQHTVGLNAKLASRDFAGAARQLEESRGIEYRDKDSVLFWLDSAAVLHDAGRFAESDLVLDRAEQRLDEL